MRKYDIPIAGLGLFRLPRDAPQLLAKIEKSENQMQGDAIGGPESRNKLGMFVVMSLQLSIAS